MKKLHEESGYIPWNEFALYYFPNSQKANASKQLKVWARRNPKLIEELEETGFKIGMRLLSPKQVRIIIRHLGAPDHFELPGEC